MFEIGPFRSPFGQEWIMASLKPFVINQTDIQFILDQLNFLPLFDESGNAIINWDGTGTVYNSKHVAYANLGVQANIAAYGTSYQSVTDLAGLRDVSGLNNNLSLVNAEWGAVDQIFTRSAAADYANYSPIMQAVADYAYAAAKQYYGKYSDGSVSDGTPTGTFNVGNAVNTNYAISVGGTQTATDGTHITIPNVVDYTPRMISLATTTAGVTYDTWANHAGDPGAANHTPNEIYYNTNGVATVLDWGQLATIADGGQGQVDPQARLAASAGQDDHFIGGLNPGVSPSNGFFVLFGQFFDHGLDFIDKSSGATSKIALAPDDPLYGMKGPDGQPVHEITISRATVQSVDANGPEYVNHTSPFIDQSQTYGSHEQLTNLLREWVPDPTTASPTDFHAGMKLFDGTTLATAWTKADGTSTNDTLPTLDELRAHVVATGRDALTWEDVSNLRNRDAAGHVITSGDGAGLSGSALLLDMNPRFDAGHLHGFYDTNGDGVQGMGEGSYGNAAQSDKVDAAISTIDASVKSTFGANSSFGIDSTTHKLTLYMEHLPVGSPLGTPHTLSGASALYPFVNFADFSITALAGEVHDAVGEILMASVGDHYVAGDGRVNENFGLTSIHHIFHEEHNYQVQNLIDALHRQDVVSGDPTHASLHDFQIDTGVMNAAGDFVYSDNSIAWDQDKMFNAAKLVVEMEYQHAAVDQYARNVTPNIQEFVGYSSSVNSAVSLEYSQAAFRFGHSTLRETIDTIDPTHGLTGKIMGYALKEAFLSPEKYADIGPAAIALGMSHQQMNEVDEFVTPALNQGLLGQPLDLAAINIARGRDIGIPTLNDFREAIGLARYTSWNDFGQNMQHPTSLENFIAAYSFDGNMAKAQAIIGLIDGSIVEGDTAAEGFTVSQAYAFLNGGDAGFNHIDTWIGGLAEIHQPGGLLGETFDKVFVNQIESLMDGDRFYYLFRLAGQQFAEEVGNGQLKDIVERNTGLTHLNGNIFGYADEYIDLGAKKEVVAPGAEALTTGNEHKYGDIAAVDHGTMGVYSNGGRGNLNDGHELTIGGKTYIQDTRMEHGFDVNVTIDNGAFEGSSLATGATGVFANPAGNYSYEGPTGWTVTETHSTDAGLVSPTALLSNLAGHDGNAVFLQNGAMIAQATGKTIAAGDSYTLSLNVGDAIGVNFSGGFARLVATTVVAGVPISVVLAQKALEFPGEGQWQNVTLDTGPIAAAYAGFELKVEIQQTSGPSGGEILVDDIKVTGVVQLNDGVNLDGTPNTGAESSEIIVGSAGDDLIYAQGGDDTVYGDAGNDTIYGGYGIDRLYGGDGADKLYGGDNPDLMDGGAGDDFLWGESSGSDINGADQVIGGSGNDFISGGIGIDKLSGGTGDDRIYGDQDTDPFTHGSDGNDYVDGGSGGDILYGDNGDDVLVGGADQDQMFGGNGDDIIRPGDTTGALTIGTDEVLGGDGVTDEGNKPGTLGFDLIDFSDNAVRPGGVTFNLADQQNPAVNVNGIPKQIAAFQTEGLIGSAGNDTLTGDSAGDAGLADATLDLGENWLIGGSGNDILTGAGGNDIIIGGSIRLDTLIGKYNSGYTHNNNNAGATADEQLQDALYQGASHRVLYSESIDNTGLIDAVNTTIAGTANDFAKHFTELLRTEMFKDTVLGDGGTDGTADTAVFSGNHDDYDIVKVIFTPSGTTTELVAYRITDNGGLNPDGTVRAPSDGSDLVVGVEQFQFADGLRVGETALLDKAPVFDTSSATPFALSENVAPGTPFVTIAAHDPNPGDTVTFSILSGNIVVGGQPLLAIDPASGQVTIVQVPDFEALAAVPGVTVAANGLSLTIPVVIGASDGVATATNTYTFQVNNVDEVGSGTVLLAGTVTGTGNAQVADLSVGSSTLADPDLVSAANPTGVATIASHQWQTSTNNGSFWTNVPGASGTAATYSGTNVLVRDNVSYSDPFGLHAVSTQIAQIGTNNANTLNGTTGADVLIGLNGSDTYTVNNAGDVIIEAASSGTDTVQTSLAAYTLGDNVENLTFSNGPTPDIAFTGIGNALANTITGGSAADVLTGGAGDDTLNGGSGSDTAVFASALTGYAFGLGNNNTIVATTAVAGLTDGTDTLNSIEQVRFGADTYAVVTSNNNTLIGSDSADLILGFGGNDTINAGKGGDIVEWNANNASANSNTNTDGRDVVDGGENTDTFVINGSSAAETFNVYTKADWLLLGGASHTLQNTLSEIIITRGVQTNGVPNNTNVIAELRNVEELVINTGGGTDVVHVSGNFDPTHLAYNTIHINDSDGGDTVDISDLTSAHRIVFNTDPNGHVIGTLRPQDVVDVQNVLPSGDQGGPTGGGGQDGSGEDGQGGGSGGDDQHCSSGDHDHQDGQGGGGTPIQPADIPGLPAPHIGTAGDDVMIGGTGEDVLSGLDGDDVILGNDGADTLKAGTGDDLVKAGAGDDVVFGNDGNDDLFGGTGRDLLTGDAGHDRLFGDAGDDAIEGGTGDDTVYGGAGNDRVIATVGDGDDTYFGDTEEDTLDYSAIAASITADLGNGIGQHGSVTSGQSGSDKVFGFEDFIGGSGNDTIVASSVANVLDGGGGNDTFVFGSAGDANGDTIKGFQPGDKIDLSAIDANTGTSGTQSFVLFAGNVFTSAGQVIVTHEIRDGLEHTIVAGNTNNDTVADFKIDIAGNHALTSADFNGVH
jgi:Ca2+-binding RTX toxin-like protein